MSRVSYWSDYLRDRYCLHLGVADKHHVRVSLERAQRKGISEHDALFGHALQIFARGSPQLHAEVLEWNARQRKKVTDTIDHYLASIRN
ncbi:MAG TPA: hypothetical protein VJC16_02035 [Candidatus Nanoarchaeia archaeon]|nr:hypothetical protein [Candidatus Nanoarchaeia archaeon]